MTSFLKSAGLFIIFLTFLSGASKGQVGDLTTEPVSENLVSFPPNKVERKDFKTQFQNFTSGTKAATDSIKAITSIGRDKLNRVNNMMDSIKSIGVYKMFIEGEKMKLPFAVLPPQMSKDFVVVIDSIYLIDGAPMMQVWMQIKMKHNKRLTFRAVNVPMQNMTSEMSLHLVSTTNVKVGGKGYSVTFNGLDSLNRKMPRDDLVNTSCFASFDCKGFRKLVIDGRLDFDVTAISQPDTINEKAEKPFSLDFFTEIKNTGDFLLALENVPDFQFSRLPGFVVKANSIFLDLSETTNIPSLSLPNEYRTYVAQKYPSSQPEEIFGVKWEGVYMPNVNITIPKRHQEGSKQKAPLVINVDDVIVDQFGVSLDVTAINLLDFENRTNQKGFKFTLDTAQFSLKTSVLTKARISGLAYLPISKENQKKLATDGTPLPDQSVLDYDLLMTRGANESWAYSASMGLKTRLEVQAFKKASMTLTYAQLDVEYRSKKFKFNGILDGSIYIVPTKKDQPDHHGSGGISLSFKKFQISTQSSYLKILDGGFFRYNAGAKSNMNNMPIKIDQVSLMTEGDRYGLRMNVIVMLAGKKEGSAESSGSAFQGNADFVIWTKREISSKRFKYDGFNLNQICIAVDQGSFAIDGCINNFEDDPVYGKGFCGNINLDVVGKIKVSASAIFGKKYPIEQENDSEDIAEINALAVGHNPALAVGEPEDGPSEYRYWFFDAAVTFSPGLTVFPGLDINALSGGGYNHMTMQQAPPPPVSGTTGGVVCKTVSGLYYRPLYNVFGFMFGLGIQSTGGGHAFNGKINFGLEFNKSGGLRKIATWGDVQLMNAPVVPSIGELSVSASTSVPKEEGRKAIPKKSENQTQAPGNGKLAIKWFVEYNHPEKTLLGDFKVFVRFNGIIEGKMNAAKQAGQVSLKISPNEWYLWVGQPTPALMNSIELVSIVEINAYLCVGNKLPTPPMALVPEGITDNPITEEDMMGLGSGFSLGFRLSKDVKVDKKFGPLRIKVEAGFAAGADFMIAKSQEPVLCSDGTTYRGKDNWYALGQAYFLGYASAKGCAFRACAGAGFEFSAYAQAQLPNPNYFAGTIKGRVKVLRWTKTFSRGFDFGNKCGANAAPDELSFITSFYPQNGTQDVSVYEPVVVDFSEAESKYNFSYSDQRFEFETSLYRATSGEIPVEARIEFLSGRTQAVVYFDRVLPSNSLVTMIFKTEIQKAGTDQKNNVNFPDTFDTLTFTTGEEPMRIPDHNIEYSYPSFGMDNFYKQESKEGYIKFATLPNAPLQLGADEQFQVLIMQNGKIYDRTSEVTLINSPGVVNVNYYLPTSRLESGREYKIRLIKGPRVSNSSQGNTAISDNVTAGQIDPGNLNVTLLEIPFRASKFNTFKDKMISFTANESSTSSDVLTSTYTSSSNETLSELELYGDVFNTALVSIHSIDYNNPAVQQLYTDVKNNVPEYVSFSAVSISNVNGGLDLVNGSLSTLKSYADEYNAQCLVRRGGCTAINYSNVIVPSGAIKLDLDYTLPGQRIPNSTFKLQHHLTTDIKL